MKQLSIAKKIFLSLILTCTLLFFGSFATILVNVSANTSYYGKNSLTVENGNFTSYEENKNKTPFTVKEWTTYFGNSETVYSGVIDTDKDKFSNNDSFTLPANPETDKTAQSNLDSKVLMIKAKENSNNTTSETGFGYKSKDITLEANKFYVALVRVKTGLRENNDLIAETAYSKASIYTNLSNSINFENISTSGFWKEYKIYIATDVLNSSSLNIGLMLGSKAKLSSGVVFFDDVRVLEIANQDYFEKFDNYENQITKPNNELFINLNRQEVASFNNSSFENDLTSSFNVEGNANALTLNEISFAISNNQVSDYVFDNTKMLFINNTTKRKTVVSSKDDNTLTIKQHGYYYLTLLIKTGSLSSGGLEITLDEKVTSGEAITVTQSDLTSSDGLDQYNGFKLVSFYIRGNTNDDSNVGITFSLGSDETNISGYAIVDNIKLYKISQSEYKDTNALDLSKNAKEATIKNGSFDFVVSSDANDTYPMMPEGWTYAGPSSLSGIVRVNSSKFANDCLNYNLTVNDNPGPNTANPEFVINDSEDNLIIYTPNASTTTQNVLMVRSNYNEKSYFTSSSFDLTTNNSTTPNKIDKIYVGVKTLNNSKAFIKIVDKDNNELGVIDNISSSNWTTYSIFIRNGISENSIKLVLGVTGNNSNNYAFFDSATISKDFNFKNTSEEDTNLKITSALEEENSCYVDLISDGFYTHKSTTNYSNGYNIYDALNWSTYKQSDYTLPLHSGIVFAPSIEGLKLKNDPTDNNLLLLFNIDGNDSYQIIKSNYLYNIKQGNYYEFSVYVKTELNSSLNSENFGAYFGLASVDSESSDVLTSKTNKFENIISNNNYDNNWEKYSIYVYAEQDDNISVLLGLGTEENPTIGKVYFDDLSVLQITKDEYTEKTAGKNVIVSKVLNASSSNNSNNNQSHVSTESNPINIFVLFSSIILGVALVFAIAGYLIRRIPKRNMAKVEKSDYSIKPTNINKNDIKQELKTKRNANISNLNKKLHELKADRDKIKKEYEEKSSQEENISLKENIYKTYTKKINKLTKQIEYIESALTFNSDEANIKTMENIEIKKKQKQAIKDFIALKNKPEEVKVEEEVKPKKTKGKKFNPNRIKKD